MSSCCSVVLAARGHMGDWRVKGAVAWLLWPVAEYWDAIMSLIYSLVGESRGLEEPGPVGDRSCMSARCPVQGSILQAVHNASLR